MADLGGLVKLADAIKSLDLIGLVGYEGENGRIMLHIVVQDGERQQYTTDGHIDPVASVAWVQLPLSLCDEIVCQAGERAQRAELDRRSRSTQRIAPPDGENSTAGDAERRAPVDCKPHAKMTEWKDAVEGDWCWRCPECNRIFCSSNKQTVTRWQKRYDLVNLGPIAR